MNADTLAWEVLIPGKRQAQSWGLKPQGTLIINEGHEDEERIQLPKTVASLLHAKQKSGEVHPSTRDELLMLVEMLSHACAKTRIERLINRREYTAVEIARKLEEDGYTQDTIKACVERACDIGLISNYRFADAFIGSKLSAGWGMGRIACELAQRGVKVDDIPGWPYEYLDPEDEVERAVILARKRSVSGNRAFPKLVQFLCGRGYTTAVAVQAAKRVLGDNVTPSLVDF